MSDKEIPLQHDMFTGELVDTRTARQKKHDLEQEQLQQLEMFSQREVAQFGVNARPLLPLSPNTRLLLIPEDPRTDEEVAQDIQRKAEGLTYQMFDPAPVDNRLLALVLFEPPCLALAVIEQMSRALILFQAA